ncbi:MAG TPA: ATP-binding protein, partial [candidate division Zixibacteria bacterium]|nr:ATP-binding protein [candidate division Zixibacteria bacterium]
RLFSYVAESVWDSGATPRHHGPLGAGMSNTETAHDHHETLEELESGGRESFLDAYQSFNRIINRLQSKYLDLKAESERQERLLAEANSSLRKLTLRNRAVSEFLNSILSSVTSGIVVVNRAGKISHMNPAAEELFGRSAASAVGRDYAEVVRCGAGEVISPLQMAPAEPGGRSAGLEKRLLRPDGSDAIFIAAAAPLLDAEGNSCGAVEVFQDVTRLKEMEREIARMETLAQLGEMAASVAHQVRNPLVSVKGFASLLTTEKDAGAKARERAQQILKGVDNLERVIDALLRFSREEELTRRPTNLNRYLKKIVRQFNERITTPGQEAGVAVEFHCEESRLTAEIDQLVLREALQNILQNSLEASESVTRVAVTLRSSRERRRTVEIVIRDDGPGMSPEVAENIFRPFYTTKSRGSGLGLPLARKVISAHRGEISVRTTPGAGAEFLIQLPAVAEKPEAESEMSE